MCVFSLLSSLALNILRVPVSTSAQVQHFKRTPSDLKSWRAPPQKHQCLN